MSQTQAQSTPLQACCPHPSASDSTVCLSTWVSLQVRYVPVNKIPSFVSDSSLILLSLMLL